MNCLAKCIAVSLVSESSSSINKITSRSESIQAGMRNQIKKWRILSKNLELYGIGTHGD
jgi:hypothetical protein